MALTVNVQGIAKTRELIDAAAVREENVGGRVRFASEDDSELRPGTAVGCSQGSLRAGVGDRQVWDVRRNETRWRH